MLCIGQHLVYGCDFAREVGGFHGLIGWVVAVVVVQHFVYLGGLLAGGAVLAHHGSGTAQQHKHGNEGEGNEKGCHGCLGLLGEGCAADALAVAEVVAALAQAGVEIGPGFYFYGLAADVRFVDALLHFWVLRAAEEHQCGFAWCKFLCALDGTHMLKGF